MKKTGAFAQAEMQRAKATILTPGGRPIMLASPEDMILAKLDWWKQGGGVSTRQWNDIVEIIKRQQNQLDTLYLQQVASQLNIADILARAFTDANVYP